MFTSDDEQFQTANILKIIMGREDEMYIRHSRQDYTWEGVERMPYKEEGLAPFKAIARQILFSDQDFECELRYFEMAADGFSTLERHAHAHAVIILRGEGHCLIGDTVRQVGIFDLVRIPAWTWHQFRATRGEPLGFLCMVNARRDKPQLPNEEEFAAMTNDTVLAAFFKGTLIT